MRIILYHPRFPTNNVIPPELDILPSSSQSSPTPQQSTSPSQSPSRTKPYTNGHGTTTAPSTVYRVSTTTGIHASEWGPANGKDTKHSNRAEGGASSSSQDTLHAGQKQHGTGPYDGERSATPTQSNTLSQARQADGSHTGSGLKLNSAGERWAAQRVYAVTCD